MRTGIALTLGLALALLTGGAGAQINPTLDEAERGIRREGQTGKRHLRIESLRVDAKVLGRTADVTLELEIASDSTEPYEANLSLALPADAVVTGYALDVGGAMIPGQLLEQPRAREVYEDELRAGIDPGLAEVSAGNRFTTRVYPIDAQHPRRVRLTFASPFDPAKGLEVPLMREGVVGKVAVNVAMQGYREPPEVVFGGQTLLLTPEGETWRATLPPERRRVASGLVIDAPARPLPMLVAAHASGERFFLIDDDADGDAAALRTSGGRVRIYWDRSFSHDAAARGVEIEALVRLVETTRPDAIDLVTFASDRPRVTTLRTAAELRRALVGVVHRGGTSLAGLDALALAPARGCVLVFDGQVTIDRAAGFAPDCALSVLTASAGADGARLGRIAGRTGGRLVHVGAGGAQAAARALADRGVQVASVQDSAGRLLAFRALPAAANQWLLVGLMPERGDVRIRLSDGSERRYAATEALRADAPGALWAAEYVQVLGDDPARHAEMVAFARRYHVAGPAMALLVLERPDQYLRAGLAPPAGFPAEWTGDYRAAKRDADQEAAKARTERFEFVLGEWRDRKTWWNTRFVARPASKRQRQDEAMAIPTPAPLMAPPPPAPEPPSVPPPSVASPIVAESLQRVPSSDGADVVVTGSRISRVPVADTQPTRDAAIKLDLADLIADRPYITALAKAAPAARLRVLAAQERQYGEVPSFFLDTAEWFRLHGDAATAELLLLSALELPTSDDETRQIVAFRLERDGAYDRAVELAEHLAAANAEFRPQPARDLALALAARGRAHGKAGRGDLERAFGLLTTAALNPASRDFDGFEVVALMEANALIPDIRAAGGRWVLDPRLVALLDTDARVVIEWTADDADIDLWVDEPNGERVYYRTKTSSAGGQISNDMTDGYGPEEYVIRRAPLGSYRVRINGYDADRINPNGPGHVLIRLVRNFARPSERRTLVDADLSFQQGRNRDDEGETRPVAKLVVGQ